MIDLDILVVLDRSGSMATGRADHEGGLRSFVEDQRTLPGDVRFTLVQFDSHNPCEILFDRVPIGEIDVNAIQLVPRGGTPLLSAVGKSIAHLEDRQRIEPATDTVVMVITDGEDTGGNGEWTKPLVQQRVKDLEAKGATVLYLGANVDAFHEAAAIGLAAPAMAASYNQAMPQSVTAAYVSVSNKAAGLRSARASGSRVSSSNLMSFTDEDYDNITSGKTVTFDGGAQTVSKVTPTTTDKEST